MSVGVCVYVCVIFKYLIWRFLYFRELIKLLDLRLKNWEVYLVVCYGNLVIRVEEVKIEIIVIF